MSLDMGDFQDDDFTPISATRYGKSGARDSLGEWVGNAETTDSYKVNLQPLTEKELLNIGAGGERIQDFRKIYINEGDFSLLKNNDEWSFDSPELSGIRFTTYMLDNRPWRKYCKCVVARNDR